MKVEIVHDAVRLHAVAELLREVFGEPPGREPVSSELLRAIAHAGGAVHVAYPGLAHDDTEPEEPLGASVAVFGPPAQHSVYSFIAAARRTDHGTGFELKQAQRAWALLLGAKTMHWTFDPLVGRNARFNLVKLGARAVSYDIDFYGEMGGINAGGPSDRLTAEWDLVSPITTDPEGPQSFDEAVAPDGGPLTARDEGGLWCRVPEDAVALRRKDPELALAWRLAVRGVLVPAFDEGYVAVGMTRDGWYRLEPR